MDKNIFISYVILTYQTIILYERQPIRPLDKILTGVNFMEDQVSRFSSFFSFNATIIRPLVLLQSV